MKLIPYKTFHILTEFSFRDKEFPFLLPYLNQSLDDCFLGTQNQHPTDPTSDLYFKSFFIEILFKLDPHGTILLNHKSYHLVSFFCWSHRGDHIYIANVCTPKKYQKKGYFQCLFRWFLKQHKQTCFRLSVSIKNPYLFRVLLLYRKYNFLMEKADEDSIYMVHNPRHYKRNSHSIILNSLIRLIHDTPQEILISLFKLCTKTQMIQYLQPL